MKTIEAITKIISIYKCPNNCGVCCEQVLTTHQNKILITKCSKLKNTRCTKYSTRPQGCKQFPFWILKETTNLPIIKWCPLSQELTRELAYEADQTTQTKLTFKNETLIKIAEGKKVSPT